MLSSRLGQVGFPAGQETFHSHSPGSQGPGQVIFQPDKKSKLRLGQGNQKTLEQSKPENPVGLVIEPA